MDKIKLFGKDVTLRTHNCSLFGEKGSELSEPMVNFYIRTKFCNSSCQFCTYASDASKYNEKKFIEVIKEISSNIHIRKIAISGGEPTLYWDNFINIINISRQYAPKCELSMNTDGLRLLKLFNDPIHNELDYIQLSRHHWDDKLNDEIFRTKTPTSDEIKEASKLATTPHQFQFRCNLIKGYIDNKEKVFQYLDWANDLEINDIGLVSLMPINQYSKDNFIHFHIRELMGENFFITKEWEYKDACQCVNYVYTPPDDKFRRPIRVYHKNTFKPSDINETIVFDGQNVRLGFDGEIIY